mmetsp:Transcript_64190/g.139634  ORF Transcript_64190/g.139634 Transcript_64190/m.139634 type:complete len:919 (-) Transcript_64190:135-2891(-)
MAAHTDEGKDECVDTRKVSKDEAAFVLGSGGKTKNKLCVVSGAKIDLTDDKHDRGSSRLEIRGTKKQVSYARKYVEYVIAQRLGPVKIDDPAKHEDLTILVVPADTVSFITGRQGSFLRLLEEEWGTLCFFLHVDPKNPPTTVDPTRTERLAIFGPDRSRRGAELKVMSAIEMKQPGFFTKSLSPSESQEEGFATETVALRDEEYSYASGKGGSTRKKLARASGCIVEYVGNLAFFSGLRNERALAREYLSWIMLQRVGEHVKVDHKGRDDVTLTMVPTSSIGYLTGTRGQSIRAIEEETNTFCFIESSKDGSEDQAPVMIFGRLDDRRYAETMVWERIANAQKSDEVGDHHTYSGGRKGKGKGGSKGHGHEGKGRYRDGGKGGYRDSTGMESTERERPQRRDSGNSEFLSITDDDAAFLMGPGGKTKRKIAAVSGATLYLNTNCLDIVGNKEERERAKKYVQLVMAQRVGPVLLDDVDQHDDLSIIEVPAEAVSFVTGKQGSFLRLVEEEFGTLLFFLDFNKSNRRDQLERLAIFGPPRERRGAELKVMAAIEMKQPGHFTKRDEHLPMEDKTEGFATDRMPIDEEDYSYALGKGGATRKKIARASGCIIEYIGRLAYLSGTKKERVRAKEYLSWLFRQRVGPVEVDYSARDDVTVLQVPKECVGFVTGHKGTSLRAVEDATGTFCFIEGGRDDPHRDPKPLLIFGGPEPRRFAEERLRARIDQKIVEGWVHEDYSGGGYHDRGDKGEKGGGKHRSDGRRPQRGGMGGGRMGSSGSYGDRSNSFAAVDSEPKATAAVTAVAAAEDDDGAWGNWGGSSDEEADEATGGGAGGASGERGAETAARSPAHAQSTSTFASRPYYPHQPYYHAAGGSSAVSSSAANPSRTMGEELDLPPQLLHEEAWPELGAPGSKRGSKRA